MQVEDLMTSLRFKFSVQRMAARKAAMSSKHEHGI